MFGNDKKPARWKTKFHGHCASCNKSYKSRTTWFPISRHATIETVPFISNENDRVCEGCNYKLYNPKRKFTFNHTLHTIYCFSTPKLGKTPTRALTRHNIQPILPENTTGNVIIARLILYSMVDSKCVQCGTAERNATGHATEGLFEITQVTCQSCLHIHHVPNSPQKPVHYHTSKGRGEKPINLESVASSFISGITQKQYQSFMVNHNLSPVSHGAFTRIQHLVWDAAMVVGMKSFDDVIVYLQENPHLNQQFSDKKNKKNSKSSIFDPHFFLHFWNPLDEYFPNIYTCCYFFFHAPKLHNRQAPLSQLCNIQIFNLKYKILYLTAGRHSPKISKNI